MNLTSLEKKNNSCCREPTLQVIHGFTTCIRCGTVHNQVFETNDFFYSTTSNIVRNNSINTSKKLIIRTRKKNTVEKMLSTFSIPMPRSLKFYNSIPDRRIFSGYPAKLICAAIAIVQQEIFYLRSQEFSISDIRSICRIYRKMEKEGIPEKNFMATIIKTVNGKNKEERKIALDIFRNYYRSLILQSTQPNIRNSDILSRYLKLSEKIVTPKTMSFFLAVAGKIVGKKITGAKKIQLPANIFYKILEWLKLKASEFRIFFIRIHDAIKELKEKRSKKHVVCNRISHVRRIPQKGNYDCWSYWSSPVDCRNCSNCSPNKGKERRENASQYANAIFGQQTESTGIGGT